MPKVRQPGDAIRASVAKATDQADVPYSAELDQSDRDADRNQAALHYDQPSLSADRTDTFTGRKPNRLQWATLDDAPGYLRATYFGREGSGKTTAMAAMANLGPVLFINAEGGLKKGPLKRLGIKVENIRVWPDPRTAGRVNFEDMEALAFQIAAELDSDPDSWAGVCVDSSTEVVAKLFDDVVAKEEWKAKRAGKSFDRWANDQRSYYGTMTSQVRTVLRRLRDLPCHFAASALERRDVDEDTGKVVYGPAVNPGLQSDMLGSPDLVLYCKVDTPIGWTAEELAAASGDEDLEPVEYRALVRPKGKFRAKDRYGVFPQVLVNPRFDKLVRYVSGDLIEEDDLDQRGVVAARAAARKTNKEKAGEEPAQSGNETGDK